MRQKLEEMDIGAVHHVAPLVEMNDESEQQIVTGNVSQLSASRIRQRNQANYIRNRSQQSSN